MISKKMKRFEDNSSAVRAMFEEGHCGTICGIKPKNQPFDFDPVIALRKIRGYLDANMRQYPPSGEGEVLGIAVQRYVAMYVDKLYDGTDYVAFNRYRGIASDSGSIRHCLQEIRCVRRISKITGQIRKQPAGCFLMLYSPKF